MPRQDAHSTNRPATGGVTAARRPVAWLPVALLCSVLLLGLGSALPVAAQDSLPSPLREVGFDQRLGDQVPLDLAFTDESGRAVRLGDYFGERPVVLALVYYECPMLCTMVLNGMTTTLRALAFDSGREFEVVAVSFDSRETPELAAAKRDAYLARYDRPQAETGWHFLTGGEEAIRRLTESVGFRFAYLPESDEFAHASGLIALTPEGRIARYFYGVEYAPRDLRLGLVEAADGKIGNAVDQILLYCFHYDPEIGRYGAAVMNLVRLGAAVTVAALALFVILMLRRERRRTAMARA